MQLTKHTFQGSNLALKLRPDIIRGPKLEYHWSYENGICPNFFFKKCFRAPKSMTAGCIFIRGLKLKYHWSYENGICPIF